MPDSRSGQEGHDRTLKRGLGKGEDWPIGCVAQGELESREMSPCVGCGVCVKETEPGFWWLHKARVFTLCSALYSEWASGHWGTRACKATFPEALLSQGVRDMPQQDLKKSWRT